jgi:hypothetical protein
LLLAHAAAQPEQPWLFVQRGLDWRWRSFGAVAARVERLRAALAAGVAGAPARIGFEDAGRPGSIALDLAIQAAGACAAPLPPGLDGAALAAALAERGCSALAAFGAAGSPSGLPVLHLPPDEASERESPPPSAPWLGGPVLVAGEGGWREVAQAELIGAAGELAARLAPARPRRGREILVLPRPLADPAGRRLAAWALAAGAALALEPDRARLAAAAAWVRPTVFAGDPDEIAALRALVEPRRRRRGGLPLGRLHTVAVLGGAPLPAAERAFWTGRGVAVTVV